MIHFSSSALPSREMATLLTYLAFLRSSQQMRRFSSPTHSLELESSEFTTYWEQGRDSMLPLHAANSGHCLGAPNPYDLSQRYWQYTSNLYRRAPPPICSTAPCWLLSFEERETPQHTSNLYCSAPPICTAVRLPFVSAILLRKYSGWGFRKVPESPFSARFRSTMQPKVICLLGDWVDWCPRMCVYLSLSE